MKIQKSAAVTIFFVFAVSIMTSSVTAILLTKYYNHVQFKRSGRLLQEIINEQPEAAKTVLEVLKNYNDKPAARADENILSAFGYHENDFPGALAGHILLLAGISLAAGMCLFLAAFLLWHRKTVFRVQELTSFLEKINTGRQGLLFPVSEGEFSKLQDEIYKTVTALYQTRDEAVEAKINFADNLSNIAHQLKTPITAISLTAQMMGEKSSPEYPVQIQKQLKRLTHLEEALLLLSRIDAGTLVLKQEEVDIFTLLTLAAENLQELFIQKGVFADIPEMEEMEVIADMDWTMEAVMNLFRNCLEHTPAGKTVHCSCEQNPLYTQIRIVDEGPGFSKEDLPHLFERFYRGQNAKGSGIGIGLPLARTIIEMQNGVLGACNPPNGGACFEIRIYSH